MLAPKISSPAGITTLTAYCGKCKDLFTVWAKIDGTKVRIELQSRIRDKDGRFEESYQFVPIPREGFYHYCGTKLRFYPDYRPSTNGKRQQGLTNHDKRY